MYKNVVVALSLEHGISDLALAAARTLVDKDGTITALHVYEPPNRMILAYLDEDVMSKSQSRAEAKLKERVKDHGDVATVLLEGQSSGRVLTDYANRHKSDCIVIASHCPGMKEFFLGSTAALVVRHAHCAVHVLRG